MNARNDTHIRSETILGNLKAAVICLDGALRVIYLNTATEILFNVSARHCTGVSIERALPCLAAQRARLQSALASGAAFTEHELHLNAHAQDALVVDCTVTPFVDSEGDGALLLEFLALDRQLRILRDHQLHNQHLASREMIRGLAHEIKNPLGGLRGAAQLLEREIDRQMGAANGDHSLREFATVIIREADRLQQLVDGLLGPRRLPDKQPVNIHEPMEHVLQLVAAERPEGIRLTRDYDPSIPELAADRGQLIQILFNLVGNAVTAVGERGRIALRTRTQRHFTIGGTRHRLVVRVDVIDDGPGIAPELLPRIFLPTVSSRADGSGMGLPIAQYLTHLHDGLLESESRPGHTVFSLFLPLESSGAEARP